MSSISENINNSLSSLPEEILSHILSQLPIKFAVQTSILSKKWRYIWTFITNLYFDDIYRNPFCGSDKVQRSVDWVLHCKTSQIKLFRLDFADKYYLVHKSTLSSWIDKAVKLKVCELDIRVIVLELPLSFFTCKTLIKLRLEGRVCDNNVEYPSWVNLPSLKTLDIVVYKNPFVNVLKLIRGCPVLESLSLEVARFNKDEQDYIFDIPTLKRLKLTITSVLNKGINKAVLRAPNREYLSVSGVLCSRFVMEDVSSLVEASISLHYVTYDYLLDDFLKGVSGVKILSTNYVQPILTLPVFANMKHLELKSFWNCGEILQFLESCPGLKYLYIEQCVKSQWTEPESVPVCMLTNLTTVKYSKCKGQKWDLHFLEYMLENAEVIKTFKITWENLCKEKEKRLRAWLLEHHKASKHCEIIVIGYSFYE